MKNTLRMAREAAAAALGRLNPRELRLVTFFAALLTVSMVYLALIEPVANNRMRMQQRITSLSRDLGNMQSLATTIQRVERELGRKENPTNTSKDFSLFSFIDRATSAAVAAEAIASMNPTRRKLPEGLEESAVELRLQDVALADIVGLLRQIELAQEPVYIKRLDLRRRYDDRSRGVPCSIDQMYCSVSATCA